MGGHCTAATAATAATTTGSRDVLLQQLTGHCRGRGRGRGSGMATTLDNGDEDTSDRLCSPPA